MKLEVRERAAGTLLRGHPWVYREALAEKPRGLSSGAMVELVQGGRFIGRGLYDDASPIAVRIYERDERAPFDIASIGRSIDRAFARREGLFDESTNAYRLCNGEGDRVPGVVVDRYDTCAVVRLDGRAIAARFDELAPLVIRCCADRGMRTVALRVSISDKPMEKSTGSGNASSPPNSDESKIRVIAGQEPQGPIDVLENGMLMEVDLRSGQKTGAFLDQRENRARVRLATRPGTKVLNLFSYTGGFSLAAALAGAERVVSVDIAAKGHATAQRTFKKNGIALASHAFVTADALSYVGELAKRRERFDLVISDPPSFAPNEKSVERALGAYAKLHRACASVLAEGGLFCASSCSSHVDMEAFLGTLDDRALERRDLTVRGAFGAPVDHPSLASFPEGRYLKFVELH